MEELHALRVRILDRMLVALTVTGLLAAVASIVLSALAGFWWLVAVDVVAWLALAFATWGRFLDHGARTAVMLGTVLVVGLSVLAATGPFGVGLLWLLAVPVLAAVLHHHRAYWVSLAVTFVGVCAVVAAARLGWLGWGAAATGELSTAWWAMALTSLFTLALGTGLSVLSLVDGLVATHHRLAEQRATLRQAKVELEDLVAGMQEAARVRATLEDRLVLAQKMEVVGQMAGGIAHDFNNVLTVIQVEGAFAREVLDERSAAIEHIDQLLAATRRAAALSAKLLLFSRRRTTARVPVPIDLEVRNVHPLLARLAGERHPVEVVLGASDSQILAESTQIEQLLTNLVANARDAMPDGGRISLRTGTRFGDDGVQVQLEVTDEGVGMDERTRTRVFEPFFTTKVEGKGTGLGLATVYAIVRSLGGTIDVESAPGRGSVFRLLLPIVAELPELEAGSISPGPPAQIEPGERPAVLLVEDQEPVRRAIAGALRRSGCAVTEARSGAEALAHLDAGHACALVVTDVVMPGMTGVELAEQVRARYPRVRLLMLTGHVPDGTLARRLEELRLPVLRKPFSPEELERIVAERLDLERPTIPPEPGAFTSSA